MEFIYENCGTNTFLTYEIPAGQEVDTMCLGTLNTNKIPGYLQPNLVLMDDVKYIRYNVTSKVSVDELFQGAVSKKKMLSILSGVVNALLASDEYIFLDQNAIVMDSRYIFMDASTGETSVVCLPVEAEREEVNARVFLKNLLTEPTTEEEDDRYITTLLRFMNKSPKLSLPEFRAQLDELSASQPTVVPRGSQGSTTSAGGQAQEEKMVRQSENHGSQTGNRSVQTTNDGNQSVIPGNRQGSSGQRPGNVSVASETKDHELNKFFGKDAFGRDGKKKEADQGKKGFLGGLFGGKNDNKTQNTGKVPKKQEPHKEVSRPVSANSGTHNHMVGGRTVNIPRTPGTGNAPIPQAEKTAKPMTKVPAAQPNHGVQQNNRVVVNQNAQQVRKQDEFPGTVVLQSNVPGTTLLQTPAAASSARLINLRTKEQVSVDLPVFQIGKEGSLVDYAIIGNSAVSRSHAKIIKAETGYLLEDTNSLNHTYINGKQIPSGVPTRIKHGDHLMFANEEFEFKTH